MALPIEALENIIVASLGEGDAITHLPDQIAPTLHFDADASPDTTHLGRDGINDIFIIDASDQVAGLDGLVNWDVGEDLVIVTNHTNEQIDIFPAGAERTFIQVGPDITPDAVVVLGLDVPEVRSMTLIFQDDPFSLL